MKRPCVIDHVTIAELHVLALQSMRAEIDPQNICAVPLAKAPYGMLVVAVKVRSFVEAMGMDGGAPVILDGSLACLLADAIIRSKTINTLSRLRFMLSYCL